MSAPVSFPRLVAVELRRATARRLVRLLVFLAVLGIVIGGVATFVHSSRTPKHRTVLAPGIKTTSGCVPATRGENGVFEKPFDSEACLAQLPIDENRSFTFVRLWRKGQDDSLLGILAAPLILAGILAAASVIGAEWRYGTVGLLLTWEPRRARVLLAKAVAVAIAAFVSATMLEVLLAGALWPAAHWHGTTAGLDAAWFHGAAQYVGRVAGVTVIFSLLGFAIGSIGRNTTAALGAALAYLLVGEAALRALRPHWQGWLLVNNAIAVINGRGTSSGFDIHGPWTAAIIITGYAIGATAIATTIFMRRDVT